MSEGEVYYKYRNVDSRTLQMLAQGTVHFSSPERLNDPSECCPSLKIDVEEDALIEICKKVMWNRVRFQISDSIAKQRAYGVGVRDYDTEQDEDNAKRLYNEGVTAWQSSNKGRPLREFLKFQIERGISNFEGSGVFSVSKARNNYLMWSHYADEHRGICIGYKVPPECSVQLEPVEYVKNRQILASDIAKWLDKDERAQQKIRSVCFFRKSRAWKYEKEWRAIKKSGDWSHLFHINEIIFGLRCEPAHQYLILKMMEDYEPKIDFKKIVMKEGGFALLMKPLNKTELRKRFNSKIKVEADIATAVNESLKKGRRFKA